MSQPILLTGFMATGKSTVARELAQLLGSSAEDLDRRIVERTGKSIPELFAERGEAGFRALEQEELRGFLRTDGSRMKVLALGGGALLSRPLRLECLARAKLICLEARPEEIARRVRQQDGSTGTRPLLAGPDPEQRILELLEQRAPAYAECHGRIDTTGKTPREIAREIQALVFRDLIPVAAGLNSYSVELGHEFSPLRLPEVIGEPSSLLLVTDDNVARLHGSPLEAALAGSRAVGQGAPLGRVCLTPGEEHKNLTGLSQILEGAFEVGLDRKGLMIGHGGGVVTDMTGFAAATWVRGVRWVGLPTTLLSMVDASVGGKTAVDFRAAKNSVGAFWQPSSVLCDVAFLKTETDRAFSSALSEVVKTALIGDPELFELLESQSAQVLARDPEILLKIVRSSVSVKAQVVSYDERETGIRAHLNLGHTIGHALEAAGNFTRYTHGEAVSLGLVAALRLGQRYGAGSEALTERTLRLLRLLGLPAELSRADLEVAKSYLLHDKKRSGSSVRFVFAERVGEVRTQKLSLAELVAATPDLAD